MREFQGRRPKLFRRLATSRSVQVFLVLILIFVGESVFRLYQQVKMVAKEEELQKRELALLEVRRAELLDEVASLGTDRGIEEAIRDRFGVVKEGEKVINLLAPVPVGVSTTTPLSWWQKAINWFK